MSDKQFKETLLKQAKQLGIEVDGRWSIEKLSERVQDATQLQEDLENDAVRAAADTWVFPIRDCFLGTEKMHAGTAFKAPRDLYMRWKEHGACRLADEAEIAEAKAEVEA